MATPRKPDADPTRPRARRGKPIEHSGIPLAQLHDPLRFHDLWELFGLPPYRENRNNSHPYQMLWRGTLPRPANLDDNGWPVWERQEFMEHPWIASQVDDDGRIRLRKRQQHGRTKRVEA